MSLRPDLLANTHAEEKSDSSNFTVNICGKKREREVCGGQPAALSLRTGHPLPLQSQPHCTLLLWTVTCIQTQKGNRYSV